MNYEINNNITSTRREISYPAGKLISQDSRYIQKGYYL